jgi:PPOX class probable F420-dependent enzyme
VIDWPAGARPFVESARVGRLATADAAGRPHLVPVCFVLRGDRVYTVVDDKPKRRPTSMKRLRNIAENPHVAVLIDRWDEDWSRLAWVMLRGTAALVGDEREYREACTTLRAKYEQYRDAAFAPASHPLIVVSIERATAWRPS